MQTLSGMIGTLLRVIYDSPALYTFLCTKPCNIIQQETSEAILLWSPTLSVIEGIDYIIMPSLKTSIDNRYANIVRKVSNTIICTYQDREAMPC